MVSLCVGFLITLAMLFRKEYEKHLRTDAALGGNIMTTVGMGEIM
jgi:hypothetical protein